MKISSRIIIPAFAFCAMIARPICANAQMAADAPVAKKSDDCNHGPVDESNTTLTEARRLIKQNLPKKAVDLVKLHLKAEPKDNDGKVVLASALNATGKPDEARIVLKEVLKSDPENDDALLLKGILDLREEKLDEAEAAFRKVIERSPQYCDAYSFLARVSLRRGDVSAAKAAVDQSDPCCADNAEFAAIKKQIKRRSK